MFVWVGLGFFLSLLTSSYDAINMFFHAHNASKSLVSSKVVASPLQSIKTKPYSLILC